MTFRALIFQTRREEVTKKCQSSMRLEHILQGQILRPQQFLPALRRKLENVPLVINLVLACALKWLMVIESCFSYIKVFNIFGLMCGSRGGTGVKLQKYRVP